MAHKIQILDRLSACIALVAMLMTSCGRLPDADVVLWEGSQEINNEESITIDAKLLEGIEVGDEIAVSFDYVGNDPFPGVGMMDKTGQSVAGSSRELVDDSRSESSFYVTRQMKDVIKKDGFVLGGGGYVARAIGIRKHKMLDTSENVVWMGDVHLDDWQQYLNISRTTFDNLEIGDVLRFRLNNVVDTAELMLHTCNWGDLPDSQAWIYGDSLFEYVADKQVIDEVKKSGLKICGVGFTVKKVEVKKPIWRGEKIINWHNSDSVMFSPKNFINTKVGDKIVACFDYIGGTNWPQVTFMNSRTWMDLPGTNRKLIYSDMCNLSVYVTTELLKAMHEENIHVSGEGFKLRAVALVHYPADKKASTAFWIGNNVMPTKWSSHAQRFEPTYFENIKAGDVIRFSISHIQKNAMISFRPGDWTVFEGLSEYPLDGKMEYYDFKLTASMVEKMKKVGCLAFGIGYTLNEAHLIKAESL